MRLLPRVALAFALFTAAALVYAGSLDHGFTNWDDDDYVVRNAAIERINAAGVREMFRPFGYHLRRVHQREDAPRCCSRPSRSPSGRGS